MGLQTYEQKRNFGITPEPPPRVRKGKQGFSFCVQKHDATRLHYDFRLELDGVLLSWAVTKGPSLDPADKRLAVRTEDHPLDYGDFEGIIPKGQYGGGTVMLWDEGTWKPLGDPHEGLREGHLKFELQGARLKGRWVLVRMRNRDYDDKRENWLLIKEKDREARKGAKAAQFLESNATSIKTERTMDQIAGGDSRVWESNRSGTAKKPDASLNALLKKYREVQLATLVTEPPKGDDWIHEIKFDGYRILCLVAGGQARIMTRNGNDWTSRFPSIAAALEKLDVESAVIDGEAVLLDDQGRTDFQALQQALGEGGAPRAVRGFFFDLLHLDGEDYSKKPLTARKEALKKIIGKANKGAYLNYSDHLEAHDAALEQACKMGLEGLVSKKKSAPYTPGRGKAWLKSKCNKRQEFVIVGYTKAKDDHRAIGALHIAYTSEGGLKYAGKVGTGFNWAMARQIFEKISPLATAKPSLAIPRAAQKDSSWVKPQILCEVSFTEWTSSGHVRHPSFGGLRQDKTPDQVTKEEPVQIQSIETGKKRRNTGAAKKKAKESDETLTVSGVTITHPERVIFENVQVTKGQLAEYYGIVAPYMMAQIGKHPLSLVRCPSGIGHECFFQRNPDQYMRKVVEPFTFHHKGNVYEYLYITDERGLVFLIQMGVIEIHPWGAPYNRIDNPSYMIFDLDPADDVPFEAVKLAALDIRARLKKRGLESFVKCTGGKGLHVTVPLAGKQDWDEVKAFARHVAEQMVRDVPDAYIATMAKSKRHGKIFIDFFRNNYTATAIADYAVRARPGAPVAVPLEWRELNKLESASQFTMDDVIKRLKKKKPDMKRYQLKQKLPKITD